MFVCFVQISEQTATSVSYSINPLTPNDHYMGRTAPLTSKRCILYIYSTNIGTECFKHISFFPFKSSLFHNSNVFGFFIIHILYTGCAKIKFQRQKFKLLFIAEMEIVYCAVGTESLY